ncbi:MAG: aminotransferase class V-fold PLP-dependent enzyme [Desulfobacteraceae bacterium]|nr:aminotransferase class V-fold PLP-dependent enzyme [Desulfobacteraceae bacterium]MBC2751993.1 aminotransferase class V-fold PLP-dependent enzyme [Desulfobacteraceae bacterium]
MDHFDPEEAIARVQREFGEHGGVCPSISRSSTFTVMTPETMPEIFKGVRGPDQGGCYLYSRHFNPTVDVLARYLAAMENTEYAICTASGMAAIACTLLQLCRQGDHIVASRTIYGGTHALLADLLPNWGISVTFVDPTRAEAFEDAARPETRVYYTETVGNPTLGVADIPALARSARPRGITLVVDNTFTPMVMSPAVMGADIVVYSMTKFINGASDLIAGAICARRDFIRQLMDLHTGRAMLLGPTMDPRTAFDIIQRIPHLAVRMREHGRRAMAVAEHIQTWGLTVTYPGLPAFPQHTQMRAMMNPGYGWGGMLTIDCGTQKKAEAVMDRLQNTERFGFMAVSLGYFDTLMSCSGSSTSSEIDENEQRAMGLSPGLVRLSIGLTGNLEERLKQLQRALQACGLIG